MQEFVERYIKFYASVSYFQYVTAPKAIFISCLLLSASVNFFELVIFPILCRQFTVERLLSSRKWVTYFQYTISGLLKIPQACYQINRTSSVR